MRFNATPLVPYASCGFRLCSAFVPHLQRRRYRPSWSKSGPGRTRKTGWFKGNNGTERRGPFAKGETHKCFFSPFFPPLFWQGPLLVWGPLCVPFGFASNQDEKGACKKQHVHLTAQATGATGMAAAATAAAAMAAAAAAMAAAAAGRGFKSNMGACAKIGDGTSQPGSQLVSYCDQPQKGSQATNKQTQPGLCLFLGPPPPQNGSTVSLWFPL